MFEGIENKQRLQTLSIDNENIKMVPFDVVTGRDDMVSQGGSVTTSFDR